MIPTALGTVVTGLGMGIRSVNPTLGWGIAGFGLAHIVLGGIDLVQEQTNVNDTVKIGESSYH